MSTIYEKIKEKRQSLGMSQSDLAKLTGYTDRSSIAKIETGAVDLTQSKIEIFAKALRTTPSYLMGWEDEVEEILEALDAVKIVGDALEQTGYYEDRFTEDEISEIMEYAHFVLLKRAKK